MKVGFFVVITTTTILSFVILLRLGRSPFHLESPAASHAASPSSPGGPPAAPVSKPNRSSPREKSASNDGAIHSQVGQPGDVPAPDEKGSAPPSMIAATAGDAAAFALVAATALPGAPVPRPPAPRKLTSLYFPGQLSAWTAFDIAADAPVIIRAAGQVSAGDDVSGPNGLRASNYERGLRHQSEPGWERVVPSAPYLALIGRVCSDAKCSAPFLVGASSVVCPSELHVAGQLQLWTNNYIRVGGAQTLESFSPVLGGFWLYTEAAPDAACGDRSGAAHGSSYAAALASGDMLREPEFRISSSQTSWKPFFVPLSQPLLIRASGEMQPTGGAIATGPDGIAVPKVAEWRYPGTRTIVVDGEHRLLDPALAYQALIGRLCSATDCGRPFLVGTERTVCAKAPYDHHLELWTNHLIGPPGLLGSGTPLTLGAFEFQERRGEYRFEVSQARAGTCGG